MPRDPNRVDYLIERLKRAWKFYPDLRLGQFLEYVHFKVEAPKADLFYTEDDEWLRALDKIIEEKTHEQSKKKLQDDMQ